MARSTKSYEERMLQLEKKEQESLEKAKQYAAQKRELKKRQKDVETKKRTHRLCQIGGAVESVLGSAIEEDDIPKLIGFLPFQKTNQLWDVFLLNRCTKNEFHCTANLTEPMGSFFTFFGFLSFQKFFLLCCISFRLFKAFLFLLFHFKHSFFITFC